MNGWTDFLTHDRADELRLEAEKQRFVRELRAVRRKERGGRFSHLLRGLGGVFVAYLASRAALSADTDVGCADDPQAAR